MGRNWMPWYFNHYFNINTLIYLWIHNPSIIKRYLRQEIGGTMNSSDNQLYELIGLFGTFGIFFVFILLLQYGDELLDLLKELIKKGK